MGFSLVPFINEIEQYVSFGRLICPVNVLKGGNKIAFGRDIANFAIVASLCEI